MSDLPTTHLDGKFVLDDQPDSGVATDVMGEQQRRGEVPTQHVEPASPTGQVVQGERRIEGLGVADEDERAHIPGEGRPHNKRGWERTLGAALNTESMDVVEATRRALSTGPVCPACIGRTLADRSRGLTNERRGEAMLIALAMSADDPLDEVMPSAPCWVCEGLTDRYDEFASAIVDAIGDRAFDTYQVGTRLPAFLEENDRLLREDVRGDAEAGESLKRECNREIGKRVGQATDGVVDFSRADIVALVDIEAEDIELTINSAFVYGRYRKLERGIPQTEWPCSTCDGSGRHGGDTCDSCGGNGLQYDRSVEQLVAPAIRDAMDGTDATFHGAGREDIDARMLGTGRPFVVEVDQPMRRDIDLEAVTSTINESAAGAVEVRELALATHEMVEHVKELDADKTYEADITIDPPIDRVTLEAAIERLVGATVEQRTPRRVDHRRADLTRTREVYDAELVEHDDGTARVRIHGAGGLYIKELLHGDSGRTEPSLAGELGVEVTVDALDVVDVTAEGERDFDHETFLR